MKIHYVSYINSLKNDDITNALKRVFPKIDIDKIISFIDNIEIMSNIRKDFYKKIIKLRYEILKNIYIKIKE